MSHPSFLSIVSAARVLRTRLCKFFFLIPGGEAIDVEYFGISFRVNECSTARFFDSTGRKEGGKKSFELSITREPEANNFIRIRKESGSICLRSFFSSSFRSTRGNEFLCAPRFAYSTRLDFASK